MGPPPSQTCRAPGLQARLDKTYAEGLRKLNTKFSVSAAGVTSSLLWTLRNPGGVICTLTAPTQPTAGGDGGVRAQASKFVKDEIDEGSGYVKAWFAVLDFSEGMQALIEDLSLIHI